MTARDELALELFIGDNFNQSREKSIADWEYFHAEAKFQGRIEHYEVMADAILAAGYRKPRTITTVAELDALRASAAILTAHGTVWVNDGDDEEPWASVVEDLHGGPVWVNSDCIELPATVIHEGAQS